MYEDLAPLANPLRARGQRVTMPKIISLWALQFENAGRFESGTYAQ